MSAEDDRAAAYRAQQAARFANKVAAEAALVPDAVATRAVWDGWKALLPLDEHCVPRIGLDDAYGGDELCSL